MTSFKHFTIGSLLFLGFIVSPLLLSASPIIQGPVVPAMYWKTSGGGNIFYSGGNIGIGKNNPSYLLDINGIINFIGFRMTTGASNNYILASDANGNARWASTGSLFSSYVETDPLVSAWAKAPTKPSYSFTEIVGTVTDAQVPDTVTINNASTATALQTARTIGGVSFNGTANINLPGVNTAGNQSTTGNAATATALQTSRTINGVGFNGTANITLPTVNTSGNQTISGIKDFSTSIRVSSPAGSWLSGMNGTNGIIALNAQTATSFHPILRQTTASGHVVALGGLGDQFGFYGYLSGRTLNGYDHFFGMNLASGNVGVGTTSPGQKLDVSGGSIRTTNQFISTLATGTSPLSVSSTTVNTNLNADLLDGQSIAYFAPIASPALSGTPTAPTAAVATNTTQIATTAFVKSQGYITAGGVPAAETDPQVGANTTNYLSKWNGTALVAGQVFDNGTNIGIGTATPGAKLDVNGSIRTNGEFISTNSNQARFISGNYGLIHRNDGTNYYMFLTASGDTYGSWNTLRPFRMNTANGDIDIGNGALYTQHGGNVGIGTVSPGQKLDVSGGSIRTTNQFISTLATGTAPLAVSSTTRVANLNVATAGTADQLTTSRTIGGVGFNGTANINLPGVNIAGNQSTTGNAATATALQTSRTINGVGFNGTANITLPTVNTSGDQSISGNKTFNNDITVVGKVITDTLVNRTVAQLTVSGSIFPNATSSQKDIGATGNRWANLWLSGNAYITGSIIAGSFAGNGSALTSLNASNLSSGTVPDARLSTNVVLTSGNQTIGGTKTFSSTIAGSITGNAGTVTNGVYTTSSYADPTWLTSLAKSKVGLANVDNTSDVNKPVSTAQQTALNLKANLASPALTGTPTAPTPLVTDSGTTIATTAFVKNQGYITPAGETDPQVGANTTNYLSKWNGTALVAGTIYNSGTYIGIGTSNPTTQLEVGGTSEIKINGSINSYLSTFYGQTFIGNNSYTRNVGGNGIMRDQAAPLSYIHLSGGNTYIGGSTGGTAATYANATPYITVLNNGNVGIGTTTPGEKLHLLGTLQLGAVAAPTWDTNTRFWMESGFGTRYDGYAHRFDVGNARTEAMRITTTGNVGIGTTGPSYKLDVAGSLRTNNRLFDSKDYTVSLTAGNWYRILTLPAANQGQYVKATIWQPNGHDNTVIELRKNTTGNGMGWTAEVYKGGAYEYAQNISNVRIVDDGTNSPTHVDIQLGGTVSGAPFKLSVESDVTAAANIVAYDNFADMGVGAAGTVFPATRVLRSWGSALSSVPVMTLKGDGNVGIGTTSPLNKLTLSNGSMGGNYSLTPSYVGWAAYGVGDGGAAIYNDSGTYKKLMIVGNNSAGGAREIGMWDNLTVNGNITAAAPTAANHVATKAYVDAAAGGGGKSKTVVITSGAGTWTVPAGVTGVEVIVVGAGGGGGCCGSYPSYCHGADGGNTTFGPVTALAGARGTAGSNVYSNTAGAGGRGGGTLGGEGGKESYYGCDSGGYAPTPGTSDATHYGGGGGLGECGPSSSAWNRSSTSFSASYGAGGAGGNGTCGGGGGGGEVIKTTIPVSGTVSYSIGAGGAGGVGGVSGSNGAGGYIQINYVE